MMWTSTISVITEGDSSVIIDTETQTYQNKLVCLW